MAQPSSFVIIREKAKVDMELDPSEFQSYIDRMVSLNLAPNSEINVRAVGMGESKEVVYLAVNVELPLNQSIHAMQFLVTNLALNFERKLDYLAVSSDGSVYKRPCDLCCKFLQELHAPDIKILTENKDEISGFQNLLLPSENSHQEDYFRLLDQRDNGLTLSDPNSDEDDLDLHRYALKRMAEAAANKSYAPYSKCPSGVALMDSDDRMYRGWYMESAAYNNEEMHDPSLGPLQAALVNFVASTGSKRFDNIVKVALVEKKDAEVRQEDMVKMILQAIANSNVKLHVFHCSEPANM